MEGQAADRPADGGPGAASPSATRPGLARRSLDPGRWVCLRAIKCWYEAVAKAEPERNRNSPEPARPGDLQNWNMHLICNCIPKYAQNMHYITDQAQASQLWPRAGPGKSTSSWVLSPGDSCAGTGKSCTAQRRPGESIAAKSRPGLVYFKLSVAHSLASPRDSESGSAAKSCLGESSAAQWFWDLLWYSVQEPKCHCIGMYSSLGLQVVTVVLHSEFGMCVLQRFGMCCVCRRFGCVVLQTAEGYVLTGFLKYWVSNADVFC